MDSRSLLFVAIGGAIGALTRYGVVTTAARWWGTAFPWGTFTVNLLGCLLVGLAAAALEATEAVKTYEPAVRYGFIVGFLGALTTFSAFGLDTLKLHSDRQFLFAALNVVANVSGGLALTWLGLRLGRLWW
jgi:fluoride exporter